MQKTILALLVLFSLGACAPMPITDCDGPKSPRHATVHYGDSELRVTPRVLNIKKTSDFELRLKPSNVAGPKGLDYATVTVSVVGKPEGAYGVNNDWITLKSGTAADSPLVWCAPDDVNEYYYEVTVNEVGKLDPRVNVRN